MSQIVIAAIVVWLVSSAVFGLFYVPYKIGGIIYKELLVRTGPEKWARECSSTDMPEHIRMFDVGMEWCKKHEKNRKEVEITSFDGLKLVGEYFDFGAKKAVIILPGRSESLLYSYYFAEPFEKAGYNILTVDIRAHGNSEGKYSCVGLKEYKDVLGWAKLLVENLGNEKVVLYGLCIGGATSIYAATDENVPDYIGAVITEGVFDSFRNVLIQRTKTRGKPPFPTVDYVCYHIKRKSGVDIKNDTPLDHVGKMKVPALFLCGKEDISSLPENCTAMYEACGSEIKEIVWFDHGEHSHLRISDTEKYDEAVISFLNKHV